MKLITKEYYKEPHGINFMFDILEGNYLLTSLNDDAKTMAILTKWIEYLISHVGKSKAEDILIYYNEINWISDKVLMKLLKILEHTNFDKKFDKKDGESLELKSIVNIHIISLYYITYLSGRPLSFDDIDEIKLELIKLKKFLENIKEMTNDLNKNEKNSMFANLEETNSLF
ncbi:FlaD/FlaE family flagellar protein [Methanotorris igneus]|uniref:Flagella protein n=1 Tax=Methanotorris igneus (strain DSM 5666 / JCM 11834 / Kol 5) TaxID=880724 RepID=F6BF42_METIK|nr:FlaD/FlaE family flagellar protein [Methanotorris igneus]AEF96912.1 flagella protein [Methanotorris igneus Kol 5]